MVRVAQKVPRGEPRRNQTVPHLIAEDAQVVRVHPRGGHAQAEVKIEADRLGMYMQLEREGANNT